jgi:hypothetical protein
MKQGNREKIKTVITIIISVSNEKLKNTKYTKKNEF